MAYNSAIPAAADLLSQSQADINNNFIAIGNFIDVNNMVLKFTSTTAPTTTASQLALYQKSVTIGSNTTPSLFWRNISSGTEVDLLSSGKSTAGWCRLPCGIVMKWATGSVTTGSTTSVSLAGGTGVPDITTVYVGSVTPVYSGSSPEGNVFWKSYDNTAGANAVTVSAWKPFSGTLTLSFYVLVMGV